MEQSKGHMNLHYSVELGPKKKKQKKKEFLSQFLALKVSFVLVSVQLMKFFFFPDTC